MTFYVLDPAAAADLREVARYTRKHWGTPQALIYKEHLKQCMEALARGEGRYRDMSALYPGLRSVLCQHHYIFGLARHHAPLVVLAVLHERMDILTRLRNRLG